MTIQLFHSKRSPWILVPAALVIWLTFGSRLWGLLRDGSEAGLLAAVALGFLSAVAFVLVRNLRRPVVEVEGSRLSHAPQAALRVQSLDLGEVARVEERRELLDLFRPTLRVGLRDGSSQKVHLGDLAAVDQARVLALLREAAGG
ncbi:MAG: hypothetical protein QNK04_13500 [Myxococcota bacterium]|nr:hypothetical protein [Myxococcota bacterium]